MDERSLTGIAPILQIHPSRFCNLACAHCYSSSGPGERGELPLELLSGCLEDAFALGYRQLAVSGGEPLLYSALAELLSHARALGWLTTVTTNGTLVTPERWQPLVPVLDRVAVSIDGVEADHDAIRCREGAFARTVANLRTIRDSGIPFGFIFTLTQYNLDQVEFVVRLAAEQGARGVQVHPLTLDGRAARTLGDSRPDGTELMAALCEALRLGHELGVPVHVDAVTVDQLSRFRSRFVPARPVERLVDVAPVLVVDSEGRVIPLTHEVAPELHLGSLAGARLSRLAADWLASGAGDRVSESCERTWSDLTAGSPENAVYWYDAIASRTHGPSNGVAPTAPSIQREARI